MSRNRQWGRFNAKALRGGNRVPLEIAKAVTVQKFGPLVQAGKCGRFHNISRSIASVFVAARSQDEMTWLIDK